MNLINRHISCLLLLLTAMLSACSDNREPAVDDKKPVADECRLTLKISSLGNATRSRVNGEDEENGENGENGEDTSSEQTNSNNSVEIIKSLRVIVTDLAGKITANEYISYETSKPIENFNDKLSCITSIGKNHIYLIANEESIINYSLEEGYADTSERLHDRLDRFFPGNVGFEDFINNLYFTPDYSNPLPMSSYYEPKIEEATTSLTLYLVPVATKFELNFYNYRNEPVTFKSISIDKIADQNYLMARIDQKDLFKTVPEDKYGEDKYLWWVDWLQAVAEDTNKYPSLNDSENSNDLINNKWGWLTGYHLPNAARHDTTYILAPDDDSWTVEKGTPQEGEAPKPGTLEGKGPFYFPESKYIPEGEKSQVYLMNFTILTTEGGETKEKRFSEELGYLNTLFRDTFITVNIELYSGPLDIYVEIRKWKQNAPAYGTIKKE